MTIKQVKSPVDFYGRRVNEMVQSLTPVKSNVYIEKIDETGKTIRTCNAKSLIGFLSLGVKANDSINIVAKGEDEESTVKNLVDLILSYKQ
jgi:phosphotransferase system HPr (HPr) family protein